MNWVLFVILASISGSEKAINSTAVPMAHGAALQCSEGETDAGLPENANSKLGVSDRVPTGPVDGWLWARHNVGDHFGDHSTISVRLK